MSEMRKLIESVNPYQEERTDVVTEEPSSRDVLHTLTDETDNIKHQLEAVIAALDAANESRWDAGRMSNGDRIATGEMNRFRMTLEEAVRNWEQIAGIEYQ